MQITPIRQIAGVAVVITMPFIAEICLLSTFDSEWAVSGQSIVVDCESYICLVLLVVRDSQIVVASCMVSSSLFLHTKCNVNSVSIHRIYVFVYTTSLLKLQLSFFVE